MTRQSNFSQTDIKLDFEKSPDGLVPVIVTDIANGQVLMLAYMNAQSYQLTLETKEMWYWSRSRQELWHKGDTSGHYQYVKSIKVDCDFDTLLIAVDQERPWQEMVRFHQDGDDNEGDFGEHIKWTTAVIPSRKPCLLKVGVLDTTATNSSPPTSSRPSSKPTISKASVMLCRRRGRVSLRYNIAMKTLLSNFFLFT